MFQHTANLFAMFDQLQNEFSKVIDKLISWIEQLIIMIPNIAAAILVLVIFYFIAKFLRTLIKRVLTNVSENRTINDFLAQVTLVIIILIGLFIALGILQLRQTVTSLLAGVGIVGLALGLAFKDLASNFFAGIYLAVRSPINEGDLIEYDDKFGVVKKVSMRATTLQTLQGQDIVIPNRFIIDNAYTHFTINGIRRIDLQVGVSYGDDLSKVEKVTTEAIRQIDYLMETRPVDFYYQEFGNSSINFVVRYWINFQKQPEYLKALSDGIKNIKNAYDANDIMITFPIRTLDFGIKGGETLKDMLVSAHREINHSKNE